MKLKFRLNTLMLLLCYYGIFLEFPGFPYNNLLQYTFMVIVGIYIVSNIRILKRRAFLGINVALLAFSAIVLYTSWINRDILVNRDPFLASIVFLGQIAELYLVVEIAAVKGNARSMVKAYFFMTAIITAITDILALAGIYISVDGGANYLVGTKFQLVYLHFFLIALYMAKHNMKQLTHKIGVAMLITLSLGMSLLTNCATGVIGVLLLIVMLLVYRRRADTLYKPMVFITVLVASFALSFVLKFISMWRPVQYILTQYLDRDVTLSSRTRIFMTVPLLLRGRYLLGYGYGTTYELGRRLGGFPNTQNALWEWIWQCGILGTVLLVFLIFLVIRYADKSHRLSRDHNSKYILILLYLFSMLASVEITVNAAYLGYLAMMIPLIYTKRTHSTERTSVSEGSTNQTIREEGTYET